MSERRSEWQELWDEYSKSLEEWRLAFESIQRAGMQLEQSFGRVMDKAAKESSTDTMKNFGASWQKASGSSGADVLEQFGRSWQKAVDESTADAYGSFARTWQKSLTDTGMEQMKAYGEMMKRFAETWNKMWPHS